MVMGSDDKAERFKWSMVGQQKQRARMCGLAAALRDESEYAEKSVCNPIRR